MKIEGSFKGNMQQASFSGLKLSLPTAFELKMCIRDRNKSYAYDHEVKNSKKAILKYKVIGHTCLLYTSPSLVREDRDGQTSGLPVVPPGAPLGI